MLEVLLEIKPLTQKSKDRLLVIGALALEIYFVYGSVSGLYKYLNFGLNIELYLGVSSIVLATILLIFLIILLASCLDKRKVLKSFKNSPDSGILNRERMAGSN